VLISTFDESGASSRNQIYTSIVGPAVRPGEVAAGLNIYSVLKLIEENWNIGDLGRNDANAPSIPNIWQ
ncbi:MAG: acid phosphatase, partial [Bdellovibrionaceae bacterium]|nr:acid phosphatase [Pseudobdellovibrionaceae bacterium]